MDHNTGQNYSTQCALVQTWNSHKSSLDRNGCKAPTFFFFFFSRKVQPISTSSLPWDWFGQSWLLWSWQLHLAAKAPGRAGRAKEQLSSRGCATCVPSLAVPAVGRLWISSSSLLHLIRDAKWSCQRLDSVPLMWHFYRQSKGLVLRKKPSAHFPLKDCCLLLHDEKMGMKRFCTRNGNTVEHRVQSLYTGKHYIPH